MPTARSTTRSTQKFLQGYVDRFLALIAVHVRAIDACGVGVPCVADPTPTTPGVGS